MTAPTIASFRVDFKYLRNIKTAVPFFRFRFQGHNQNTSIVGATYVYKLLIESPKVSAEVYARPAMDWQERYNY